MPCTAPSSTSLAAPAVQRAASLGVCVSVGSVALAWVAAEMEVTPGWFQQLQREPALWLRARPGQAKALAKSLFAAEVADLSHLKFQISNPDAVRFTGVQDLFKTDIRKAVETLFNVKVLRVHTQTRKGKPRRTRTKMTKTSDWKKAIVKLHGDSRIELF